MRLFRRGRDTKASAVRRESPDSPEPTALDGDPSVAPSSVRRSLRGAAERQASVAPPRSAPSLATSRRASEAAEAPASPPSYEQLEDSDVFICKAASDDDDAAAAARAAREVTLFVHGWHNVEPGLLSWTFPSLRAALDAVQRMKNAIGWCVVSGTGWTDLDAARASGAILVEQLS